MTTKRISSLTGKPISIEEELDVTKTESIECLVVALKNPVCKGSLFQLVNRMPETRATAIFDKIFRDEFTSLDVHG